MKLSDFELPSLEMSPAQRETLHKYLPLVFVAMLAWFAARCFRKMFWIAFAMFWAFGGAHSLQHWLH